MPRTREWDSPESLASGLRVVIRGAAIPGGRISLFYPQTGETTVAAYAGDYIYPADVRVDLRKGLLYVKAHGLAGGKTVQTWLFEYDIQRKELIQRRKVADRSLPEECE